MESSLPSLPSLPSSSSSETFKIVYNNCYGGFDLSSIGLEEYNRRSLTEEVTYPEMISRDDAILINMVETMGKEINCKHSKLETKEFPKKFKEFLEWDEYDGRESVRINYDRYVFVNIKLILEMNILPEEKIEAISKLYCDFETLL